MPRTPVPPQICALSDAYGCRDHAGSSSPDEADQAPVVEAALIAFVNGVNPLSLLPRRPSGRTFARVSAVTAIGVSPAKTAARLRSSLVPPGRAPRLAGRPR